MADDQTVKLPSDKVLRALINKGATTRSKVATLNGDYGESIADAVDKQNLHAGAFKLVAKLQRMDPVKLNAFLTHLDDYREKIGLDKIAAQDLPGFEAGDDDEDGDMGSDEDRMDGASIFGIKVN